MYLFHIYALIDDAKYLQLLAISRIYSLFSLPPVPAPAPPYHHLQCICPILSRFQRYQIRVIHLITDLVVVVVLEELASLLLSSILSRC